MNPKVHKNVYTMQDRLDLVATQIDKSITTPQIETPQGKRMLRDLSLEIVQGSPEHGQAAEDAEMTAIFNWVKANIEFREDPFGYDEYRSAGRTITARAGDCDDHCIVTASLLTCIGFRCGSRCISPDQNGWHLYTIVGAHSRQKPEFVFPFDTTQTGSFVGWEPRPEQRRYMLQCEFINGRAARLRSINK